MKQLINILPHPWKRTAIVTFGGLLIGAGVADCVIALDSLDLNQIARGLTIFSAGLTILVVIDNSKTQKQAEQLQQDTQLRLERIEHTLNALHHSQQITSSQFLEIKELMQQQNNMK